MNYTIPSVDNIAVDGSLKVNVWEWLGQGTLSPAVLNTDTGTYDIRSIAMWIDLDGGGTAYYAANNLSNAMPSNLLFLSGNGIFTTVAGYLDVTLAASQTLYTPATEATQTSQGTTLGTIATQTTAASIAAAVWNALVASYQSVTGSFGKLLNLLSVGTTINVTGSPINVTVAIPSGQPARQDLVMVQGEAKTWVFTLTDLAGDPIDETGKTLKFVIEDLSHTYLAEVVSPAIAISGNVISVTVPDSVSASPASRVYHLWNTTDDIVRVYGSLEIPAAAQPV